jgi:hypothetical protein
LQTNKQLHTIKPPLLYPASCRRNIPHMEQGLTHYLNTEPTHQPHARHLTAPAPPALLCHFHEHAQLLATSESCRGFRHRVRENRGGVRRAFGCIGIALLEQGSVEGLPEAGGRGYADTRERGVFRETCSETHQGLFWSSSGVCRPASSAYASTARGVPTLQCARQHDMRQHASCLRNVPLNTHICNTFAQTSA